MPQVQIPIPKSAILTFSSSPDKLNWTTNFKEIYVSVMNMLSIYLFASMKLEKGHTKKIIWL